MTDTAPALHGLRVLDFSHALAGPYCTMLLGSYGADVYKLEAPGSGDMGRGWGPPFTDGEATFFLGLNRNKRGLAIDLKRPEGLELCLRLIEQVDVVIENFRPGTMDRLGLGYDAVRARNRRLVYCSISGYGQNGPDRDEAAMDLIVQASSGLISITGTPDGQHTRSGHSVADITAGMFSLIGILMALRSRELTGEGQYVDVSMLDCMISAMTSNYMNYLGSGVPPQPMGTAFPTIVPYRVYEGSDRGFAIAVASEKLWSTFCGAIGRPDLERNPDYATNADRVHHRAELEQILDAIFRERSAAEWVECLKTAGIPCSLVRTLQEVAAGAQAGHRGMFPRLPTHVVTGPPLKFSNSPAAEATPAPALGEDTVDVLAGLLGFDEAEIENLKTSGVIAESR